MVAVDGLQTTVLIAGSALLGFATLTIAWRELRSGGEAAYLQGWLDIVGLIATVSAIGALVAGLWISL